MPSAEKRQRLAAERAALVSALISHLAPPEGFDVSRVKAAAAALARKRCRSVAKAWPILTRVLGERFEGRFAAFAIATPLPLNGGPLADGRNFAHFLAAARELPEEARLELMAVDLNYAATKRGLLPRRSFAVRLACLGRARRLVLGIRLPWFGVRWLSIPLGRTK
jgi:hypothetical protein